MVILLVSNSLMSKMTLLLISNLIGDFSTDRTTILVYHLDVIKEVDGRIE